MSTDHNREEPQRAFPFDRPRWQRWLWSRLPLGVRSFWNPHDNFLRGYTKGYQAGRSHVEEKWRGNITGEGPYANYPPPR